MPRMYKKRLNEDNTSTHSKVIAPISNILNCTNRKKKLRRTMERLENLHRGQLSCNTMSGNVSTSSSTDSVIYVGSYKLNETYSLIDLTESNTSIEREDSFSFPKYVHSTSCYTFYKSLVRNSKLTCIPATSCLLDTSKLSLINNAKPASLIVATDKQIDVRNSYISNEPHGLGRAKENYSDKITELIVEDQTMINHSLEIEDDINILELCSPQNIITDGASVKNLMHTYNVVASDEF